jgi:hypothetical protein
MVIFKIECWNVPVVLLRSGIRGEGILALEEVQRRLEVGRAGALWRRDGFSYLPEGARHSLRFRWRAPVAREERGVWSLSVEAEGFYHLDEEAIALLLQMSANLTQFSLVIEDGSVLFRSMVRFRAEDRARAVERLLFRAAAMTTFLESVGPMTVRDLNARLGWLAPFGAQLALDRVHRFQDANPLRFFDILEAVRTEGAGPTTVAHVRELERAIETIQDLGCGALSGSGAALGFNTTIPGTDANAMLDMRLNEPHRRFGQGLRVMLSLPLESRDNHQPWKILRRLQHHEWLPTTELLVEGSWSTNPHGTHIKHSAFYPSAHLREGTGHELALDANRRAHYLLAHCGYRPLPATKSTP